jgi:hypothetical protein
MPVNSSPTSNTFPKPDVYQTGSEIIVETDKYIPDISGPGVEPLVLPSPAAFKEWLTAASGKFVVGHISVHPPVEIEVRASEVVQLSLFSAAGQYQPLILPVKNASEVRQVLQYAEQLTPAKDFRAMWTFDARKPVWEQKPAASVSFNARNYRDSAKFRAWHNFLYEYEDASDDRNYVYAWSCDKIHLRMFIHQQRICDLKVITVNFSPGNGPYILEYLLKKAEYVKQSLAV